jgi:hypothetical protein
MSEEHIPQPLTEEQVRAIIREYEVRRPHHLETSRQDILGLLATLDHHVGEVCGAMKMLDEQDDRFVAWLTKARSGLSKASDLIERLPASEQQTAISVAVADVGFMLQETLRRATEAQQKRREKLDAPVSPTRERPRPHARIETKEEK